VPAGNRFAVMVAAQRDDFGGPIKLEVRDLPPGVTAEIVPMSADETSVPVLFSAAADAKPAGSLANLVGRGAAGSAAVEGHLRQRTLLVRGANNREIWSHDTYRMAVAVTQRVPFRIDIVEPKVPLVQSEVVMPLTADGGAAVRKWKIAVLGWATVGDGTVVVSSPLANLEVAEPFFRFAFQTTSVDQGQKTGLLVKVEKKRGFPGTAKVELLGLPHEVTAPPQDLAADAAQIVFPVTTTANSPVGQHRTLLCRAVVTMEGQPVTHLLGMGELRIEKPLPPKPAQAAAPKPTPAPEPAKPPAKPVEKPLSRLERLRMERSANAPPEKK